MTAFLKSAVQELSETHKKWLLCMWRNHPNMYYVCGETIQPSWGGGGREGRKSTGSFEAFRRAGTF